MKDNLSVLEWLDIAVSGIRFGPDRAAVRKELDGHIEDRMADLRRIFPNIPQEEASARALSAMGDPEELKISLARVHRPWLGWLWTASKWMRWCTLAAFLLICAGGNDHYQSVGFPLWMDWAAHYGEPVACSPERAEVGGYTFQIVEGAYREDGIVLTLRASSLRFSEKLDAEALNNGLTAVAPDGTRLPMGQEIEPGVFSTVYLARWDLFSREFDIYVPAERWEPGAWVSLELDSGVGGFTLSAQVTEEVTEP